MIQRLLRGRMFYLVGMLLIVVGYVLAIHRGLLVFPDHETPAAAHAGGSMEWWPKGVTLETVRRLVTVQPWLAMAISLLVVTVMAMGVWGIGVTVWMLGSGRLRSTWAVPSRPLPPWSFGELGRILLLIMMFAALLFFVHTVVLSRLWGLRLDLHQWIAVSMLLLDGWVIGIILVFAMGKGASLPQTLGVSPPMLRHSIASGVRGYLMAFPWLFMVLFAVAELARLLGIQPPIEPIQELIFDEQRPSVLGSTILLACLIGPVAEELFFRGVLYPAIRQRMSRGIAQWASAAVFSFVHTNIVGFVPIAMLGYVLANLYERTGSLASSLTVHILHNTLLMSLAMALKGIMALSGG